jgi:hypothetical protein
MALVGTLAASPQPMNIASHQPQQRKGARATVTRQSAARSNSHPAMPAGSAIVLGSPIKSDDFKRARKTNAAQCYGHTPAYFGWL